MPHRTSTVRRIGQTRVGAERPAQGAGQLPHAALGINSRKVCDSRMSFGLQIEPNPKDTIMAKGQVRSNREVRKPKKAAASKSAAATSTVSSTFAKPAKGGKSGRS